MSAAFVVRPREGAVSARRPVAARAADAAAVREEPRARQAAPDGVSAGWTPTRAAPRAVDPASIPAPAASPARPAAPHRPLVGERHPVLAPLAAFLDDDEVTDVFVN